MGEAEVEAEFDAEIAALRAKAKELRLEFQRLFGSPRNKMPKPNATDIPNVARRED